MTTNETVAIISDLQRQIDEIRTQLAQRLADPSHASTLQPPPTASRRNMLKLAGATAVGAVASTALASRAAAEIGYSTASGTISQPDTVLQTQTVAHPGKTGFLFTTANNPTTTTHAAHPSALGGWSFSADQPSGVYGYTEAAGGAGVVGLSGVATSVGVRAEGPAEALRAHTTGASTQAIHATAAQPESLAIRASSPGLAIRADGLTGLIATGTSIGIQAAGPVAIDAVGVNFGLQASSSDPNGTAVFAFGTGTGIDARASNGAAVEARGSMGAVLLLRSIDAIPPARTTLYTRGTLDVDGARELWYCYESGTPGKWRKLSGGSTAGAFHSLTPGRVYDSRTPEPSPGTLAAGNHRTISVKDRRNTETGAIVQPDFIPAGATAVAANLTVVTTAGGGYLAANPGGETNVNASTINWTAPSQVFANGVILTLNNNRELTIVAGAGTTHFLLDITGYWL